MPSSPTCGPAPPSQFPVLPVAARRRHWGSSLVPGHLLTHGPQRLYSLGARSTSPRKAACWARRASASGRVAGPSSEATEVCVRPGQAWKSSKLAGSPAAARSPSDSSAPPRVGPEVSAGLHLSSRALMAGSLGEGVASSQALPLGSGFAHPGDGSLRSRSVPVTQLQRQHQPGGYPGPGWTQ